MGCDGTDEQSENHKCTAVEKRPNHHHNKLSKYYCDIFHPKTIELLDGFCPNPKPVLFLNNVDFYQWVEGDVEKQAHRKQTFNH